MSESKLNREKYKKALIQYWMEKAEESVESANAEYQAGRLSPAIRSTYYACFYALSAVLWKKGKSFKKHTAVRAALHRDLVKTGIIDVSWGQFYNVIFERRHKGDYDPMVKFEREQVEEYISKAESFVKEMEKVLIKPTNS